MTGFRRFPCQTARLGPRSLLLSNPSHLGFFLQSRHMGPPLELDAAFLGR